MQSIQKTKVLSKKVGILVPELAWMKKDNTQCMTAEIDFKVKMLPKESLPSNNMTSVLETNVFNSPQNRMMNYLMPLGWWMMPLDKLASTQMTNTSVKTRLRSFPPLSDMEQTGQWEAIAWAPTSSYTPALGSQIIFNMENIKCHIDTPLPSVKTLVVKKQKTKASNQVFIFHVT